MPQATQWPANEGRPWSSRVEGLVPKFEGKKTISKYIQNIHPGRLTWNLTRHLWKRKIIFQTIIFRFYVNLRGCIQISNFCSSLSDMFLVHFPTKRIFKKTHLSTMACGGKKTWIWTKEIVWNCHELLLFATVLKERGVQLSFCFTWPYISWHTLRVQTVLHFPTISAKVFYHKRDLEHYIYNPTTKIGVYVQLGKSRKRSKMAWILPMNLSFKTLAMPKHYELRWWVLEHLLHNPCLTFLHRCHVFIFFARALALRPK